ncbi:DUF4345 domain-containing protein [Epilithonimonas hungarica]|uniref:DUF4345 domain-containing protein n=1 Tax=Epilithonimonas hungarica TaxID=454006 RepID=A0A1G7S533_9FLAO|nr:DUF4345 domain-containing protein [Epilithonimonas hungarica]SDG18064.1 protein of unknown function [Epilithonimonas hungarica]
MENRKQTGLKNLHLLVSVVLVFAIALTYGFFPEKIIPALADIRTDSNDLSNAFKAVMGLYLGIAAFWALGIARSQFWKSATLVNIFFMFSLVIGRITSLAIDGFPTPSMLSGIVLELLLGIWGLISLSVYSKRPDIGL